MKKRFLHIYNRGAHKADVFKNEQDYWRMLKVLYIANSEVPFNMYSLSENIFLIPRRKNLVDIIAYCLMPNHFHIAICEISPIQTSRFMQKLGTSYSCYFNKKYVHSGTIWQGGYKSKYVDDEDYFEILLNYIHLNPYRSKETPRDTNELIVMLCKALEQSKKYEFSSFKDYLGINRPQSSILASEVRPS
ncbi:MAG: transposase [Patescibacteria group bacterium]|nr:transposase [Patescibacteria group bacterium]